MANAKTSDEAALLEAIRDNPHESVPRKMLSDLLAEEGRHDEAVAWARLPHRYSPFESLIGRTVSDVRFDGAATVTIYTDDGPFSYRGDGDCCSESWLYRIIGADRLIGQRVVAVAEGDNSDVDVNDGLGRQEEDSVDGYGLLTGAGLCEITWRNSSNGYYGNMVSVSREDLCRGEQSLAVSCSWQHPPSMSCVTAGAKYGCRCVTCLIPGAEG